MPDLMTEAERASIRMELIAKRGDSWTKTSSESDHRRNQVYFWFQVRGQGDVQKAMQIVLTVLKPHVGTYLKTEFNAAFIELEGDREIMWDTLTDDEIRKGELSRLICEFPNISKRSQYSVFDREM